MPKVLAAIGPDDVVLDIGGWAQPNRRADYVVDLLPYETRGTYGHIGDVPERFTKDTWIVHDVSSRNPLPFIDKQFDFVICSHTLEDIRDPIHLCAEIIRVGKRGYIETPSRLAESTFGVENPRYAGYFHHRWLVVIDGDQIVFRFKTDLLYESRCYHLPRRVLRRIPEEALFTSLFWEGSFGYKEIVQVAEERLRHDLAAFVERHYPPAVWERMLDAMPRSGAEARLVASRLRARARRSGSSGKIDMPDIEST